MSACRGGALLLATALCSVQSLGAQTAVSGTLRPLPSGTFVYELPASPRTVFMGFTVNSLQTDDGVKITAVTPGGPADRAGLRAGDIVTRVNGVRLATSPATPPPIPNGTSPAVVRLVSVTSRLSEGDTATLQVLRDQQLRTLRLVPVRTTVLMAAEQMKSLDPFGRATGATQWYSYEPRAPERNGALRTRVALGSPVLDMQLAPLNPELGRYFGASSGVLVLSVPGGSAFPLQGGDVVLSLDGRQPETPMHLFRILQTYSPGESVEFEVLRDHRRMRVSGRLREPD